MKRVLLALFGIVLTTEAFATDIASCSNPAGKAYYPYIGLVPKKMAGWMDDGIKGGVVNVTVNAEGKYDVLYLDARKEVVSATSDGATVLPFAIGVDSFGLVTIFPKGVIETYTFVKNKSGAFEYIHTAAKAGDAVSVVKSSLFRGACSYINFNELK